MSAQTSYLINQAIALAGMIADLGFQERRSFIAEGPVDFGIAVSGGTDKEKQVIAGGTDFYGISYRSIEREGQANGTINYLDKDTVGVLREGYIWVTLAVGAAVGASIKYTNATGALSTGAAVAGETQLDDARLETVVLAGELGLVRLAGISTTAGA